MKKKDPEIVNKSFGNNKKNSFVHLNVLIKPQASVAANTERDF